MLNYLKKQVDSGEDQLRKFPKIYHALESITIVTCAIGFFIGWIPQLTVFAIIGICNTLSKLEWGEN